jgi:hypothetical protein
VTIGLLTIDLLIPGSRSLKDKRRVVKSLKEQLRSRFNTSIAEVEPKEHWGRARLAACVVGDDSRFVNTQLNEIARFACNKAGAEVVDYHIEMM